MQYDYYEILDMLENPDREFITNRDMSDKRFTVVFLKDIKYMIPYFKKLPFDNDIGETLLNDLKQFVPMTAPEIFAEPSLVKDYKFTDVNDVTNWLSIAGAAIYNTIPQSFINMWYEEFDKLVEQLNSEMEENLNQEEPEKSLKTTIKRIVVNAIKEDSLTNTELAQWFSIYKAFLSELDDSIGVARFSIASGEEYNSIAREQLEEMYPKLSIQLNLIMDLLTQAANKTVEMMKYCEDLETDYLATL